jgi:hypothetical protein
MNFSFKIYFRKEKEGREACACEIERGGERVSKGTSRIKRESEREREKMKRRFWKKEAKLQ